MKKDINPVPALLMAALSLFQISGCAKKTAVPLIPPDYASWRRTIQRDLTEPIPGHEDRGRRIFINQAGSGFTRSFGDGSSAVEFPEGTVIVKEIYGKGPDPFADPPVMLTVMKKDPDDRRALGGWVWIVKDLGTGEEQVMTNSFCVTCHANANEPHPYGDRNPDNEFRDYVFYLPE